MVWYYRLDTPKSARECKQAQGGAVTLTPYAPSLSDPHFLSPTGLQALDLCERYGYLSYVRNRTSTTYNDKLTFGSVVHQALAEYGKGRISGEAVDVAAAYLSAMDLQAKAAADSGTPIPDRDLDSLQRLGQALLPKYVQWANEQSSPSLVKYLHVEQEFLCFTRRGTTIGGVFDVVAEDSGGGIWIGDYKTCGQLPNQLVLQLGKQAGIYLYAGYQLWGDQLRGLYFDHIRRQDPSRTSTPLFLRTVVTVTRDELWHWEKECDRGWALVQDLLKSKSISGTRYNPGPHCSWRCPFTDICLAARSRSDQDLEFMLGHYPERPRHAFEEDA